MIRGAVLASKASVKMHGNENAWGKRAMNSGVLAEKDHDTAMIHQ